MKKGLAIIEANETETNAVFIDHETIEFARQNAKTKKRLSDAENAQRKAYQANRKAEREKARRIAYTVRSMEFILVCACLIVALTLAGTAGMIHPAICIPVSLFCLCAACLRLGMWFGKRVK